MRSATAVSWFAVCGALWALAARPARAAIDERTARERAAEVLRDPELQTERPDGRAEVPPPPPPERPRTPPRERGPSAPVQAPSEISQALIWIVVGAIAVALVAVLVGQLGRSMRRRKLDAARREGHTPVELALEVDARQLDETLRRALALAEAGRYEEAVHVLLQGAIADLQERAGLATEPALTSRELLQRAALPADPRAAFAELVVVVEVSLFGGLAVTRDDFDRCATSFRLLRKAVVA